MFKKNTHHLQPAIISAISELPEKQLKLLEESWAYDFYQDFFKQIDEEIFAVLYSSEPSRPNVPVNVLVGMEVIKAGYGWSDEELYENYCFNLQVRYALGYDRLGEGDFAIRTLYNFRKRLSQYQIENGENLLEAAFQQVTDIQIRELEIRTGMQRMDSTQIASNIVEASRLQLPVRGQFRVTCMMIGSAIMSNIRRIQQYRIRKMTQESEKSSNQSGNDAQVSSLLSSFWKFLHYSFDPFLFEYRVFGC